ncbi:MULTISPECIES: sn-glycerol-3-phosphate import ATP-binding protein UgpC [Halomonadaceae]|jgi:sn-glycerol 3-phosphate transport system ATP-binding protein|uniref:Sn-glycerol-3-phosphate ABC transporter ATP-binding protein UgpC n=2 Tax=Halomonadaceae TaxID=28256 RepID=A0AAQ0CHW2_9GAMM|nr:MULTISPECIES: sn-glycerol-3-phosphate import ATP-binding protein UgpC [Halomonas]AZM94389.1 sn-glycerol-3-phosphate import ATP-binding protein UgpC [Halomonas venusta]MDW0359037.1 sn-glycerol-3-phosphate import ATP-binding protein UgpC [Halomonas venusta]NPT31628.1 sn-glycerol-3-phosphate ABC transporter ATP-binding protein UgpC [Halomonas venusta]QPI64382.1 sn-glycerol-3-phosphate import ATP-binding protein UgpC [Halomonas venusta]QRL03626.1 sn-glycerol-3-phosphate import ATP-binding prote
MASITLEGLKKTYTGDVHAVKGIDLQIEDGEFVVLVGPSGCGKSTLLRMVAGLETITEGTLKIGDRVVNKLEPAERDIAMVFQNYALYPHMTVYNNLAYGLKNRGFKKDDIDKRVRLAAKMLEIEDFLERKPRKLSGGQRQRVAMGRALVREPSAFLFDEPLSNLDAKLRVQMRVEIKQLQRRLKTTSLYVTHDQLEAMTLGDRLVVLNAGQIEQVGTPMEIYARPATMFVAEFIGSPAMNMLPLDYLRTQNSSMLEHLPEGTDTLGIRPDDMHLTAPDAPHLAIDATLMLFEAAGAESHLYVNLADSEQPTVIRTAGQPAVREGEALRFYVPRDALHPFNSTTQKRTDG